MNEYKIFCFSLPKMYNRNSYKLYLFKPTKLIYGDDRDNKALSEHTEVTMEGQYSAARNQVS
jgi:hypothetical protein